MKLMFEYQKRWQLSQLPVAQQNRNVFQAQHQQITRDAKRNLGQHGVSIRVPECEPRPQRLPDVDHQYRYRAAVADEADDHRSIQNRLQFNSFQDVDQKSREECPSPQRDDAEIEKDPQTKGEAVVHVGLVEPVEQAETSRVDTDREQDSPWREPEQKPRKGGALGAASYPSTVSKDGASHVAPPDSDLHRELDSIPPVLSPRPPLICNKALARFRAVRAVGTPPANALLSKRDHLRPPSSRIESLPSDKPPRKPEYSRPDRSLVFQQRLLSPSRNASAHGTYCISPRRLSFAPQRRDSDSSPSPLATTDPTS